MDDFPAWQAEGCSLVGLVRRFWEQRKALGSFQLQRHEFCLLEKRIWWLEEIN